ncbi:MULTISPECIES: hypothetical protein [Burkholderia]|uniref:hypothetical protein n=1 Tax=Burkholderia TaxID=32008 RepID=UPI00034A7DB9|nr:MULTISPECIES: hypothetical protein [Burkholderia]MBF3420495.1 hypothetical protein [Burkholderia pseudomallei]MBF3537773.1 hypothetical protein [Burkholderia pseudomallei]MBF3570583.1 hypothetical protein [Burkholderia pseudomallei]MBF3693983.1 hypothetical protein [Burkholderia pseudomallei]MBF3994429.1 hypothetical protein [Burkholderia pseudomallei]
MTSESLSGGRIEAAAGCGRRFTGPSFHPPLRARVGSGERGGYSGYRATPHFLEHSRVAQGQFPRRKRRRRAARPRLGGRAGARVTRVLAAAEARGDFPFDYRDRRARIRATNVRRRCKLDVRSRPGMRVRRIVAPLRGVRFAVPVRRPASRAGSRMPQSIRCRAASSP